MGSFLLPFCTFQSYSERSEGVIYTIRFLRILEYKIRVSSHQSCRHGITKEGVKSIKDQEGINWIMRAAIAKTKKNIYIHIRFPNHVSLLHTVKLAITWGLVSLVGGVRALDLYNHLIIVHNPFR